MKATITSKGQITIPKKIREKLNLQPGDVLDFDENAPVLTAKKGLTNEDFERFQSFGLPPDQDPFRGMSVEEIILELRGPVDPPRTTQR